MQLLRANTAVDVLIGPFVDDADGDTPATGLTLDVELSKNGQALTDSESGAPTHDAAGTVDGYYNCILGTTDTNTEGQLVLVVHHADALPIRHEYMVMAEAAYDSMFVAKDAGFMDVNVKTIGRTDTQETEADNLESACSNYSVTRGLTGTAVPAAAADAAGGLPISTAGSLDLDAMDSNINDIETDTNEIQGKLPTNKFMGSSDGADDDGNINDILGDTNELQGDWTNAGRLDTIIDSILSDTGELQTDWANGGRLDLIIDAVLVDTNSLNDTKIPDTISLANIESECNDALVALKLDHLVYAADDDAPADGSIIAMLADNTATADWSAYTHTNRLPSG